MVGTMHAKVRCHVNGNICPNSISTFVVVTFDILVGIDTSLDENWLWGKVLNSGNEPLVQ